MNDDRTHRAVSDDGTQIAGRVYGHGPPLVLVHGGLGDDLSWGPMIPYLAERFSCYTMSTRGRGLSVEPSEPDYSLERLVQDVVAFVESIGEPVGLVGYSLGGALALGATAHSPAISSVAVYEPAVFEAHSDADPSRVDDTAARLGEAVAEERLVDAALTMVEAVLTDDERVALSASGVFEAWGSNVLVALREAEQASRSEGPSPTDPALLARIKVPALYLRGTRTPTSWYVDGARQLARHVPDLRRIEINGAGHFAPILEPRPIADELVRFFTRFSRQPLPDELR
jgi:pimeloyl-ACP methyl ester carboxylesterase